MASTKRIQNAIDALKEYPDISIRVILQRQSGADNTLAGVYEGTPYETVMGDVFRAKSLVTLPILYYGPLFLDSVMLGTAPYIRYVNYAFAVD